MKGFVALTAVLAEAGNPVVMVTTHLSWQTRRISVKRQKHKLSSDGEEERSELETHQPISGGQPSMPLVESSNLHLQGPRDLEGLTILSETLKPIAYYT